MRTQYESFITYDAVGNQTTVTDREGNTTRFEYDAVNRLVRTIDPNGAATRSEYDLKGQLVATTDPIGVRTTRQYDAVGQLTAVQVEDNPPTTRQILYDDAPLVPTKGLHHVVTDPTNYATTLEFDALGRLSRSTDELDGVTAMDYYLYGKLRQLTDPDDGITTLVRDSLGRVESATAPHTADDAFRSSTTVYDELDMPLLVTRPNTCSLQMRYDEMGRMVRRRSTDCVSPLGPAPEPVDDEFGYDARGNLIGMRNPAIGIVREYDSLNRLAREIDDRLGTGVAYDYDRAGRLVSKVLPDGTTIHASYDAAGRVVGIADPFGDGDLTQLSYDAAGRTLARSSRASDARTEYAYDGLGRLASVESFRADGTKATSASYPVYDDAGNRKQKQTLSGTTDYEYDELHRLALEAVSGEADVRYEYTAGGDRSREGEHDGNDFTQSAYTYTYRAIGALPTHQLESAANGLGESRTFSYDQNGAVYQWTDTGPVGTRTIQRDALGRIVSITGSGFTGTYRYDPLGRRIEKIEQGQRVIYQYDRDQVVAEYSAVNVLEAIYIFGPGVDQPIKVKRGATVAAYHSEGLGSIEAVSDLSTSLDLVTYEYDAFGVLRDGSGSFENPYTYTGRELDASGLYYYRGRYYLPEIGRFLSSDPAGLAGGTNAYAYVNSNPVNFVDPFGLFQLGTPLSPPAFDAAFTLASQSGAQQASGPSYSNPSTWIRAIGQDVHSLIKGAVVGGPVGIVEGLINLGKGVIERDPGRIGHSLVEIATAPVRYGNFGGLAWGDSALFGGGTPTSPLDAGYQGHDIGFDRGDKAAANSALIRGAWSRHDLGPYGQVHRILSTAAFSVHNLAIGAAP